MSDIKQPTVLILEEGSLNFNGCFLKIELVGIFLPLLPQKVKAIREEKCCDVSVTECLVIKQLYGATDSEVRGAALMWGAAEVRAGKQEPLFSPGLMLIGSGMAS